MGLDQILKETGAHLSWEPYRNLGRLEKGVKTLTFALGDPWMILDYDKKISTGTVLKERGELIFSQEAAGDVLRFFDREAPEVNPYNVAVILIDPGHGGKDPGTLTRINVEGVPVLLEEKNIVLDVSLRLADQLRALYPHKKVLLTRDDDTYPTLEERVDLANSIEVGPKEGILFVAVHVNASLNSMAEGYEVWYLPKKYRRQIVTPGDFEGNVSLLPVVNTILEEQYAAEGERLAQNILDSIETQLPQGVPNRGLKEESWFVVRNAEMASVLVELGFITHKEEAARLMETSYLKKLSNGLYNGIRQFVDYFEEKGFGN